MKKFYYYIVATYVLLGCAHKNSIVCDQSSMKVLPILSAESEIKIPALCILEDTLVYGTETFMHHQYRSVDSTMLLFVYVKEDNRLSDQADNFGFATYKQRRDIVFGTTSYHSITDTVFIKNKIKVGYLKYAVAQADANFISSRIFFIRNKKICVIELLEKCSSEWQKKQSMADCMVETLRLY